MAVIGTLVAKLNMDSRGFSRGSQKAQGGLNKLDNNIGRVSGKVRKFTGVLKAAGVAAAALGTAVVASVFKFAQYGDTIEKMAARTGFSTNALSELGFAAEQSGFDIGTLEKGIKGMQMQILNAERGLSTATDSLSDLGLSFSDLQKLSPEEQFSMIAGRIADVADPSKKAALAMSLFGKAGQKMIPLLNGGADSIAKLRQEARNLGISMSPEDAKAAADFTDAWNRLKKSVTSIAYVVGAKVIPVFTDMFDLAKVLANEWRGAFSSLLPSLDGFGNAAKSVLLGLVRVVNTLTHFFVAVIPAVLKGFADNWHNVFKNVYDYTATIFKNLTSNIKSAMIEIWEFITSRGVNKIEFAWKPLEDGFVNTLKSIDIPERIKTDLEKALEGQLEGGKRKRKGGGDGVKNESSLPDLPSSKSERTTAGAALRGSNDAISAILRNVSGGKNNVEQKILEANNKQTGELKKQTGEMKKQTKAIGKVAFVGASI